MNQEKIPAHRIAAGFIAGAIVAIGIYEWLLWPPSVLVAVIGGGIAAILIPLIAVPILIKLRRKEMLSIYAAALLGGALTLLPALMLGFFNLFNSPEVYQSQPETGLLFLLQYFFLPGAIGGAFGWLVAAGFRTRAA